MKANIVDLRYKTKEILKALDRRERVEIMCRGRLRGVIMPVNAPARRSMKEHPFFGCMTKDKRSVKVIMGQLRKPRYAV